MHLRCHVSKLFADNIIACSLSPCLCAGSSEMSSVERKSDRRRSRMSARQESDVDTDNNNVDQRNAYDAVNPTLHQSALYTHPEYTAMLADVEPNDYMLDHHYSEADSKSDIAQAIDDDKQLAVYESLQRSTPSALAVEEHTNG